MTQQSEFYRARSKFTLEPMPTPEEIFKDMVQFYLDNQGYGDLHDVYKVLLPIDPAAIGIQLFSVIEDMNEKKMLENNQCPECSLTLEWREIKANRTDPWESWLECQTCQTDYERKCG